MQVVLNFMSSKVGVSLLSALASVVGVWLAQGQPALFSALCIGGAS